MSPKLSRFFVSVAVFLAAASALPQCGYVLQYSGEYRASILDLSLVGNELWAATGYGAQLYDPSVNPPKLVASVRLPGFTNIIRAVSGTAFAGGTSGITVLRHVGNTLPIVQPVPLSGLNDLLVTPTTIYAATATGLTAFNMSDMSPAGLTFQTSTPNVTSLAFSGSTLFAADGDNTIEVFSIPGGTSPVKLTSVTSALRATSVEAIGTRLYVSDGLHTEIFSGTPASMTSLGILPFGAKSIADLGSNVVMVAGNDRQLRAVDATIPQNFAELFDAELPPSGGTINRVTALQSAGGRLYAGGGDIGLATFDVSHFTAPYPMRAYAIGQTTSVAANPSAVFVSLPAGGIQEMTRLSDGGLQAGRTWDATEKVTLQDASDSFLLASAGSTLEPWFLGSSIPTQPLPAVTFSAAITSAFLTGTSTAAALLQDGTVWTVDFSQANPAPARVGISGPPISQLAHSSAGFAAASSDGTNTTVQFWTSFTAAPVSVALQGVATALALDGSTAAVFTFRGIAVIDFSTSTLRFLAGSNDVVTTGLAMSNGKVIAQTQGGTVRVWDVASGALQKEFAVPGLATAINAAKGTTIVGVATATGVATIDYAVAAAQPVMTARTGANAYYKKAVAGGTHLYLFDGRTIDVYNLKSTNAPSWSGSVFAPGTLDIAASDTMLFALSNTEVVTEYSAEGVQLRSKPLDEGDDVTPLGIAVAGGVPWVSFSRGCTTSGCEKRTDVLDPQSLVRTSSFAGGTIDATTSGTRAFAIFDLPSEIRIYDISDPLHPSPLATRANDAGAVAIGYSAPLVYALADKAYAYDDRTLSPAGTQLASQKPGTSADLLIDTGCATVAGRTAGVETYQLPVWSAASPLALPGSVRSMVDAAGRLIVLTDYSIEIWSRTAATTPVRRRATRE